MKKIKILLTVVFATILFFAFSAKANAAVNADLSGIPTSVESGKEFNITLKFSENIGSFSTHIKYDPHEITILSANNSNLNIEPEYGVGDAAVVYVVVGDPTTKEFTIKAKAAEVTEDEVTNITVQPIDIGADSNITGGSVSVTIKAEVQEEPAQEEEKELTVDFEETSLAVGNTKQIKASGNGSITYKSSNASIAKVDEKGKITALEAGKVTITVTDESGKTKEIKVEVIANDSSSVITGSDSTTSPKVISKTGEKAGIIAIIMITVAIVAIAGIKFKKMNKYF